MIDGPKTKENGTGLDLMVCFKIIEQHDGITSISSQLNKGTTVEISLPVTNSSNKPNFTNSTLS